MVLSLYSHHSTALMGMGVVWGGGRKGVLVADMFQGERGHAVVGGGVLGLTQGTVMQFVVSSMLPLSTKVPVDQRRVPSRRVHSTRQAALRGRRMGMRVVRRRIVLKAGRACRNSGSGGRHGGLCLCCSMSRETGLGELPRAIACAFYA